MRLLIMVDGVFPDIMGGVSKSVFSEAVRFVELGHQVTIITRAVMRGHPSHESIQGCEIFRFDSPPRQSRLYHLFPLFTVINASRLARSVAEHGQFDLINCHYPFLTLAAELANLKLPTCYTFHAPIREEITLEAKSKKYKYPLLVRIGAKVSALAEQQSIDSSAVIIARSLFTQNLLNHRFPSQVIKSQVVPLGIDTLVFAPQSKMIARQELGLPSDRTILITARRLEARMGIENLLDAMEVMTETNPRLLLLILGDGYLRHQLEAQVVARRLDTNVLFAGFVPEGVLPRYYNAADLFILPSIALEGFGLATIEALSCGLPVVGTSVGATPEILTHLDSNLVVEDPTPKNLAAAILKVLNELDLQCLSVKARKLAVELYDIRIVSQKLIDIFETIL